MSAPVHLGLQPVERLLAAALEGAPDALGELADADADGAVARRHRAGPALHLAAHRRGLEGPDAWRRALYEASGHYLVLRRSLARAADVLAAAAIPWVPIKGMDLAQRVYDEPEQRPTGDIDLLVRPADGEAARDLLRRTGWKCLNVGRRDQRFVRQEGYAWRLADADGVLLELHFRLWGALPEELGGAIVARGRDGHPELADAYVIAAVHAWTVPPPRPLIGFWDLRKIARHLPASGADAIVRVAAEAGAQLPVALASAVSAALWPGDVGATVARRLAAELRAPERRLLGRSLAELPWRSLVLARLLAHRPSRLGWRSVWRRAWPHPGIVERETPDGLSWWRRRCMYQLGRRHPTP